MKISNDLKEKYLLDVAHIALLLKYFILPPISQHSFSHMVSLTNSLSLCALLHSFFYLRVSKHLSLLLFTSISLPDSFSFLSPLLFESFSSYYSYLAQFFTVPIACSHTHNGTHLSTHTRTHRQVQTNMLSHLHKH